MYTDSMPFERSVAVPESQHNDYFCDGCQGCVEYCRLMPLPLSREDVYPLLYALTKEIALLEEELIYARKKLIQYLPPDSADALHQNILSGMSMRFKGESELYDQFVEEFCSGTDPLESDEHIRKMLTLRNKADEGLKNIP